MLATRPYTLNGILLMAAAYAIVAGMDGVAKLLAGGYHPLQIAWRRYLFQSIFMSFVIFGIGRKSPAILRTHRPGAHAVRAFFSWVSNIPFIVALIFIPLADATAAALVGPLIVTALSVPLFGRAGWLLALERGGRWHGGRVDVVRPGMGVMHWAPLCLEDAGSR